MVEKKMKKWTMADINAALEEVDYEDGMDYKDYCAAQYDAMADYALTHDISMSDVPNGHSCPHEFIMWCP